MQQARLASQQAGEVCGVALLGLRRTSCAAYVNRQITSHKRVEPASDDYPCQGVVRVIPVHRSACLLDCRHHDRELLDM
jgi:hypothetical protein